MKTSGLLWLVAALVGVWWILAAPLGESWGAGLLAVAVGVGISRALRGKPGTGRLRPRALLGFAPWFVGEAVRGGVDVSRRALSPSMPLAPGTAKLEVRLPEGPARVFFVNSISLLPGTFSAALDGAELTVHLLTVRAGAEDRLRSLEERVADLFGVDLAAPPA